MYVCMWCVWSRTIHIARVRCGCAGTSQRTRPRPCDSLAATTPPNCALLALFAAVFDVSARYPPRLPRRHRRCARGSWSQCVVRCVSCVCFVTSCTWCRATNHHDWRRGTNNQPINRYVASGSATCEPIPCNATVPPLGDARIGWFLEGFDLDGIVIPSDTRQPWAQNIGACLHGCVCLVCA